MAMRTYVPIVALRWAEATVSWNLVDHDIWTGYDGDRAVAQVSTEWADGEWRWAAYYWGDLPIGSLGVSLGHDPRRRNGTWRTAEEAMAAVDAQA
jgi:hypothetical protein